MLTSSQHTPLDVRLRGRFGKEADRSSQRRPTVVACPRLEAASEVCVVLGGGHTPAGDASRATLRRAEAAARVAADEPQLQFVLSGGHAPSDGPVPMRSEAALMAEHLLRRGVDPSRLYLEDQSRNTIGNAVLTALRYFSSLRPRPILLVSCGFHLRRATLIFSHVLGPAWQIRPVVAQGGAEGPLVALREAERLAHALAFFAGIPPGDLQAIEARFLERWTPLAGADAATAA